MTRGKHLRTVVACGSIGLFTACGGLGRPSGTHEPRTIQLLPHQTGIVNRATLLVGESRFAQNQLRYARVRAARNATQQRIVQAFDEAKIPYPAAEIYLRVFKRQHVLEVWARPLGQQRFRLLKSYEICALAGVPGPKRRRGDMQVPEGFYYIERFNPSSEYHLSLKIDYPNARDRAANAAGHDLGGDIYIHGGCASAGCLAITNAGIEELYWLGVEARALGQERIPVHIFPARLDHAQMRSIDFHNAGDQELIAFWKSLKPGYDYFEKTRRVPQIETDTRGTYLLDN